MKILYVERNPVHRELTAHHLERKAHEVVKLIPQFYFSAQPKADGSEPLENKEDLVARIKANNPNVLLLDRESFKADDYFQEYISTVLDSGYSGKTVLTHTASRGDVEDELGDYSHRVQYLNKPFGFQELDEVLSLN